MATSTIQISQLTLAAPVAADSVAGANAAGQARRYTVGSLGTAHTHDATSISAGVLDLSRVPTHTHSIAQVSGLQASLDGKAALAATNVLRVETLNALNGAVTIEAGSGVTVATQGSKITISAAAGGGTSSSAVSSVNGATGAVVLTSASVSAASAVHTHVISEVTGLQTALDGKAALAATNVARVVSLNGLGDSVTIAAGANVTVSTAGSTITIAAAAGGGGGDVASVNGQTGTVVLTNTSVSAASSTHASQHQAGGADLVLPVVTSATITASVNNYTPPVGDIIRLTSTLTSTAVITGLSGGSSGYVRLLSNVGTNTIRLVTGSTNSDSTNRFLITGGSNLDLGEGESAAAWYDATSLRWRVSRSGSTQSSSVVALNGLSGTVTLVGVGLTVATAAGQITLTAGSGGGGGIVSVNGQTATAVTLSATDVTAASTSHMTTHRAGGSDELLPLVTAVSLTASVNDYSLPTGDIFRLSHANTTTVNITGLATAVDGSSRLLVNVSTGASSSYTIKHADTNSTAVSRFLVPWAGDYVLSPNGGAALVIYDDTDDRWRVV